MFFFPPKLICYQSSTCRWDRQTQIPSLHDPSPLHKRVAEECWGTSWKLCESRESWRCGLLLKFLPQPHGPFHQSRVEEIWCWKKLFREIKYVNWIQLTRQVALLFVFEPLGWEERNLLGTQKINNILSGLDVIGKHASGLYSWSPFLEP